MIIQIMGNCCHDAQVHIEKPQDYIVKTIQFAMTLIHNPHYFEYKYCHD